MKWDGVIAESQELEQEREEQARAARAEAEAAALRKRKLNAKMDKAGTAFAALLVDASDEDSSDEESAYTRHARSARRLHAQQRVGRSFFVLEIGRAHV